MRLLFFVIAVATAIGQTPADWQTMKDKKDLCQISVPAGGTVYKSHPGSLVSPDGKTNVGFGGISFMDDYPSTLKHMKQTQASERVIEQTPSRIWISSVSPGNQITVWRAAIDTKPVCEADVTIPDRAFEATARMILNSLRLVQQ